MQTDLTGSRDDRWASRAPGKESVSRIILCERGPRAFSIRSCAFLWQRSVLRGSAALLASLRTGKRAHCPLGIGKRLGQSSIRHSQAPPGTLGVSLGFVSIITEKEERNRSSAQHDATLPPLREATVRRFWNAGKWWNCSRCASMRPLHLCLNRWPVGPNGAQGAGTVDGRSTAHHLVMTLRINNQYPYSYYGYPRGQWVTSNRMCQPEPSVRLTRRTID